MTASCGRQVKVANVTMPVGDIIAMVVADTATQARDAVEAIGVTWEDLPAVVDVEAAIAPDAPAVSMAARQRGLRHAYRRQGEDRRGLRLGAPQGSNQDRQPARGRELHGAAFRGGRTRSDDGMVEPDKTSSISFALYSRRTSVELSFRRAACPERCPLIAARLLQKGHAPYIRSCAAGR